MVDDDRQVFVAESFVEQVAQLRLRPHQVDTHGQSRQARIAPRISGFRSFVGAYGV